MIVRSPNKMTRTPIEGSLPFPEILNISPSSLKGCYLVFPKMI